MRKRELTAAVAAAIRTGWVGSYPPRYFDLTQERFCALAQPKLVRGSQILDVGSGRRPVLEPERRPAGSSYVGLDLSASELERAGAGAYDEVIVGDIGDFRSDLSHRFDLIVTWWVLEHVQRLNVGLENLRRYLKPGQGRLVAYFSGRNSVAALANRLLPAGSAQLLLHRLNWRSPETVFPAYYDRCTFRDLEHIGKAWRSFEIIPVFQNGLYLRRARPLLGLYLGYEEWAYRTNRHNLATHYLLAGDA